MRWAILAAIVMGCSTDPLVVGTPNDIDGLTAQVQPLTATHVGPVVLKGTVGQVCEAGCWFYLLDTDSLIFVQLDLATGQQIPTDSTGREALVKGTIVSSDAGRTLVPETVILMSKGS